MAISQQKKWHIDINCYAYTSGLFASMCNPKNRGVNFHWSRFPDMAANLIRANLQCNMKITKGKSDIIYEYADFKARVIANRLISELDFE